MRYTRGYSEEPGRLTRRFGTQPMRQVNERIAAWMHDAGMTVRQDNAGNLIGRYEASSVSDLTDIAMLFVRCKCGISHHPAESVTQKDVVAAIEVLEQFLALLAKEI